MFSLDTRRTMREDLLQRTAEVCAWGAVLCFLVGMTTVTVAFSPGEHRSVHRKYCKNFGMVLELPFNRTECVSVISDSVCVGNVSLNYPDIATISTIIECLSLIPI